MVWGRERVLVRAEGGSVAVGVTGAEVCAPRREADFLECAELLEPRRWSDPNSPTAEVREWCLPKVDQCVLGPPTSGSASGFGVDMGLTPPRSGTVRMRESRGDLGEAEEVASLMSASAAP